MDVRDGFILGIYNYCDRWCESCAFTSRCGAFARAFVRAGFDEPDDVAKLLALEGGRS